MSWLTYCNKIYIELLSSKSSGNYFDWIGEIPKECMSKIVEISGDIFTFDVPKQIRHFPFRTINVKGKELWVPDINFPIEIENADLIFVEGWCAYLGTHPSYYHRLSRIHFVFNPKFPIIHRNEYIDKIINEIHYSAKVISYEYDRLKIQHYSDCEVEQIGNIILRFHDIFRSEVGTYLISPTSYIRDVLITNYEGPLYLIKTRNRYLIYSPSTIFLIPARDSVLLNSEIKFSGGVLLIEVN